VLRDRETLRYTVIWNYDTSFALLLKLKTLLDYKRHLWQTSSFWKFSGASSTTTTTTTRRQAEVCLTAPRLFSGPPKSFPKGLYLSQSHNKVTYCYNDSYPLNTSYTYTYIYLSITHVQRIKYTTLHEVFFARSNFNQICVLLLVPLSVLYKKKVQ